MKLIYSSIKVYYTFLSHHHTILSIMQPYNYSYHNFRVWFTYHLNLLYFQAGVSCLTSMIVPRGANARMGNIGFMSVCVSICVSVPNRGGTLCARLSPNRFTYLHILGANQLYNNCRCATYLSVWHWLYFRSSTRSQKTLLSCMLYIRRVVLVSDSAQTSSHICTYLVPINCTIIIEVQDTFHCDLDLISDPAQGHK